MSDAQAAELYERLVAARSKQATADRLILRGWNLAIHFAIKSLREATGDSPTPDQALEDPQSENQT